MLAMICLLAITSPATAETITTKTWRVVDGDTVDITIRLRLAEIDAPEIGHYCQNESGETWHCGQKVIDRLNELLGDEISCELFGSGRYNRHIASCFSNGVDVQKILVEEGLAVAEYGDRYRATERQAQEARRGMWAGDPLRPRDWRRQNPDWQLNLQTN